MLDRKLIDPLGKSENLSTDRATLHGSTPSVSEGDVRSESVQRVASSVGEGSICVQFVHRHLANV
jgi:thioredoxin reductase (NADPH)